jgi:hypothetical protein
MSGGNGMFDTGYKLIRLFQWMASNGSTLRDYGPTKPFLLGGDEREKYERATVETLYDFGFLQPEKRISEEGEAFTDYKLSEKAYRLVDVLKARESEEGDLRQAQEHFWIVVANESVFIDLGIAPPNLKALIDEAWNDGDRIVITCHDPQDVLASHLRLALASEVYGGLTSQEIGEIEKMATDRSPVLEHSRT